MKTRRHLLNLIFWISLSILFNIIIYYTRGETSAIEYFGGYIVEMSLSLDNLFLFLMIFSSFRIQEEYQERILLYGVIGAMVLRLIFILLGVAMVINLVLYYLSLEYYCYLVVQKYFLGKMIIFNFMIIWQLRF